jgi:hypothetical protein
MLKYIPILSFGATLCGIMPAAFAQNIQTGVVVQTPVQVNTSVLSNGFSQGGTQASGGAVVQNSVTGPVGSPNVQTGVVVQTPVQVNTAVLSNGGFQGGAQFTGGAVGQFRGR